MTIAKVNALSNTRLLNMVAPINWLAPMNKGLVAHWLCVPGLMGGEQLFNLVSPPHSISLRDGASFEINARRVGGFGSAHFDGANDYGIVTQPFAIPTTVGSLSLWHMPIENQETTAHPLVLVESATSEFALYPFSDGHTYGGWYNAGFGDDRVKVNTPAATIGTWHHWYLTWVSGGVANIYYDGMLVTPVTQPTIDATWDTSTAGNFRIACAAGAGAFAFCRLDDIRIYSVIHDPLELIKTSLGGYEREFNWIELRPYAPEQAAVGGKHPRFRRTTRFFKRVG